MKASSTKCSTLLSAKQAVSNHAALLRIVVFGVVAVIVFVFTFDSLQAVHDTAHHRDQIIQLERECLSFDIVSIAVNAKGARHMLIVG